MKGKACLPGALTLAGFLISLLMLAGLALLPERHSSDGLEAARTAANWVGVAETDKPRREDGEWEIDVVRADGSLVEVTIGNRLELRGTDEELGPRGGTPPDEVTGSRRARAVRAALAVVSGGRAVGVERERDGKLEVAIRLSSDARVEVGLDRRLRVVEVESESPGDE